MFTSVVHNQAISPQKHNKLRSNGSFKRAKKEGFNNKIIKLQELNINEEEKLETSMNMTTKKSIKENNGNELEENVGNDQELNGNKLKKINSHEFDFAPKIKKKIEEKVLGKFNHYIFQEKIERAKYNNYFKTKKGEFLYYQFCYNTFLQCIFSLSSIFSSILAYEIEYNKKSDTDIHLIVSLWFSFITSVCLWVTIIYEYFISCKISAINKNLPEKIWRKETYNIASLCFTIILFFLHPNPVLKGEIVHIYNEKYNVNAEHSWNSIMTVLCLLRMWYFVKFYLVFSDYYSPRTQRVCQMNNFDTNLTFSMKANMTKTPYHAYLLLFSVILMYCSFCLRIFERVLDEASGKQFSSFWNSIWCLIITMTTVGYGDYFPSSTLGRTIGVIACICGVFLISMLIVTITNVLQFQGTEENVFLILQRLKLTKEKDELAAKLISKYMKMMKSLKNSTNEAESFARKENLRKEILIGLYNFKEKCKEIDSTFPAYSNFDIIIDNLELLDTSMNNFKKKYEVLEKHIEKIDKKLS